jgi:hypothetical protein
MGFMPNHSYKSLLLMYMYTKPSTQFDVNRFHTLLWTNEYELQLCLHNDLEPTCTKMRQVIGANVCPLAPIKSYDSCGNMLRSFIWGVLEKRLRLLTKFMYLKKLRHKWFGY